MSGSPSKNGAFNSSSITNMSEIPVALRVILSEAVTAPPHVFCDMDGVVADFHTGVSRAMGVSVPDVDRFLQQPDVWEQIAQHAPDLFVTLPKLADASKLISGLVTLRDEGRIRLSMLTAIPNEWAADPTMRRLSTKNKKDWMTKYFPAIPSSNVLVVVRADKKKYAAAQRSLGHPPAILIDDYIKNIREWDAAGGWGIHHTAAVSSLRLLTKYVQGV